MLNSFAGSILLPQQTIILFKFSHSQDPTLIASQMGNNKQGTISPLFNKQCHRQLAFGSINQKQQTIELRIAYNEHYHQWRWNLFPLMTYQRSLMLPRYIVDCGVQLIGCQGQDKSNFPSLDVGYDPYVYTLENELMARKFNGTAFTEREIGKIVKGCLQALKCWVQAYPGLQISMQPKNVLFDDGGHVRVVHLFSFPPEDFLICNGKVVHYEEINPKNALMKNKSGQNEAVMTNSVNQLGQLLFRLIEEQEKGKGSTNAISSALHQLIHQMAFTKDIKSQHLDYFLSIVKAIK